ncbi:M20/M25/M40 family metallo-hydrolase [Pseudomarimonas salicorniae]|uniref:M20/M25/M40 family metallo-hydrolase n=1 Tax=Pseudomarimonas salicorniae TaxID=2933270 RepID=A0ABT0GLA4_9GAMM|nr:M20/M25/M40 family metallo-hydrolase [Lysobacter sp. CAU 1642]MCK7595019.1 M20/M25/M40 family metallo-hydrolase [Lysobacter sp. CAU 1642]
MIKTLLKGLSLLLVLLVGVLAFNTWRLDAAYPEVASYRPVLDEQAALARLSAALRIRTLSASAEAESLAPFLALHDLISEGFPRVHGAMEREVVNGGALLFRLPGREHCPALLLAAHQDVVPVEPGSEDSWRHPPWSGALAEGAVWGRGAIDDKGSMMAILEAVEALLAEGFRPRCPLLLAFGHDEETGGQRGAAEIARLLAERSVEVEAVLDEGGAITTGLVPGTDLPLASVGVAEKGYLSLRLTASGEGGHSSMPPHPTVVGRLAQAIARLEAERPPPGLSAVHREMLARIAPHVDLAARVPLANLWLFEPMVVAQLAGSPTTDATLRTTTAPTQLRAGVKDNILPRQAEAVVNFRIQPGDSVVAVTRRVRQLVEPFAIEVAQVEGFAGDPVDPADWNDPLFAAIERSLLATGDGPMLVAPYVTSGATDARHYAVLTPRLYRFSPVQLDAELMASFHGSNERMPVAEYARMQRFYRHLLATYAERGLPDP